MDDSYKYDHKNACTITSSTTTLPAAASSSSSSPPDEISLFLQQILVRTASGQPHSSLPSSSPSIFSDLTCNIRAFTAENTHTTYVASDEISAVDSSEVANSSSSGAVHDPSRFCPKQSAGNASSTSFGASGYDNDDLDCESEEGLEGLGEELPTKRHPRCSSKRSRAAEVHNLSEKRRRSRINEKMKALQNLIPNSNKTDKASMLDEAIEYLKQLQLQVQMLSMRNGLSLHPMSLPGSLQYFQLSHMRMNFGEENRSLPPRTVAGPSPQIQPTNHEQQTEMYFTLPDHQRTPLEPSIQYHQAPFNFSESSKICREDEPRDHRANTNQLETTQFEFEMGSMAAVSPSYHLTAAPELPELSNGEFEPGVIEMNQSGL